MIKILLVISVLAMYIFWKCVRAGAIYDNLAKKEIERPDLIQFKNNKA